MEHKSWLWKKKSMEKTMFATDKANRGNEDELQGILGYEAELERNLNISNEKLSAALAEIKAKDDIAKKQTNIAREAIQGWEKAEAEVLALKQELEKATQQTVASEERLYGVDAALKECMQQLRFVREEQEKRIHDAVMKTSREYEKSRIIIEEKLSESNKKLSNLNSENTHLTKALLSKEKVINELHSAKNQLDSDLSSLMSRFESTQRDNASLSYEVRVMEKELEIRNEERDFNRRTADVAHKQHLASVKKIAQLETEAQRLRVLVRKRLPGPAALAKMKNEVEMLGKKSNASPYDHDLNTSSKQINYLTEQLCSLEEENKVLKEFITQKTNGFSASSDVDEKTSMAESWAPSCKTAGASDIGLMDDFVEMEKLAIVSVEKQETPFDKRSIERLIEIIEGISLSDGASESSTGYTVRVLQWKTCELGGVLEAFVQSCSGLLNGKVDLEKFVKELTLTLEWIVNHCFSLQDVSSMRHEMEKRFDWDDTRGELEEVKKLKDDLDILEQKLELEVGKSESLFIKVQESEKMIESLEMELESLKVQKEKDMKGKEDLDEQLIEAIGEYNEVFENSMSVEGQGSNNSSCNLELEDRNLDEVVVVDSTIEPDIQTCELNEEEKRLQSEREIIAASEKLAECQETIFNLGKQLKALASPINPSVPDKIICNPTYEAPPPSPPPPPPPITTATNHHRISLLDKMMAEDAGRTRESTKTATPFVSVNGINGIKNQDDEEGLVNFLSIVPSKKKKTGVLRKLLWRRTKTNK